MKKNIISFSVATGLLLGIAGCAGIENGTAIKTETTKLKQTNKIIKAPKYLLSNGAIITDTNNRILDEEGDIVGVYNISNKPVYLLKVMNKEQYKVKTIDKKVLKTFDAKNVIPFYGDNVVLFAVKLKRNVTDIYDNIYSYNGSSFNLIDKNVNLSDSYPTGLSALKTVYDRASSYSFIKYQKLQNMLTKDKVYNKKIPTQFKAKRKPIIIGSRGDKVFYTYAVSGGMYYTFIIEAYDMKTKKNYVIVKGRTKPQVEFLTAGNKVVLKTYNPQKYIYLNTLEEVKGVSGKFKANLPKMELMEFRDNLVKLSHSRSIKPLF
jgi:hypothetical protein